MAIIKIQPYIVDETQNFTFNNVTATGNLVSLNANLGNIVVANYFAGNGSSLTSITGANVTGQVANALVATTAGTVTTAAQPNITSVGTLSSLAVTGNANVGNIGTGGLLIATGNIEGGNLSTGGTLSVTGNANVGNIGAGLGVFTANISANNLTTTNKVTAGNGLQVTTGALAILSGNLDITGNLNVTGNVNYSNVTDLVVGDPLIYIGEDNSGDIVDLGIVGSYNNGTYVHTGIARNASNDYWTFFDGVVAEPTTVIDWANATYPTVKMGALLSTSTITGTQLVSNIATGTAPLVVTSTTRVANLNVAQANVADFIGVTTATSGNAFLLLGNAVTGNIAESANSVFVANSSNGAIHATTFVGALSGAATTAGTVTTNAQPNITSVGTLTSLSVTGNISAGNLVLTGTATSNGITLGYLGVPLSGSAKTSSYTLATTDIGKIVTVGTSGSIIVPDATFSAGDAISIFNDTSGNVTITCSITTAYIGGTDADKSAVTLATRGIMTVLFISGTVCVITGNVT